jgi:hypothetical protein
MRTKRISGKVFLYYSYESIIILIREFVAYWDSFILPSLRRHYPDQVY